MRFLVLIQVSTAELKVADDIASWIEQRNFFYRIQLGQPTDADCYDFFAKQYDDTEAVDQPEAEAAQAQQPTEEESQQQEERPHSSQEGPAIQEQQQETDQGAYSVYIREVFLTVVWSARRH